MFETSMKRIYLFKQDKKAKTKLINLKKALSKTCKFSNTKNIFKVLTNYTRYLDVLKFLKHLWKRS